MGDRLTCPVCGDTLGLDEEWLITDRSLIGTRAGSTEDMQGDYAHAECLQTYENRNHDQV